VVIRPAIFQSLGREKAVHLQLAEVWKC